LPAPLSPSRQWTSLRSRFIETCDSATMWAKCFDRSRTSMIGPGFGASWVTASILKAAGEALADAGVEHHGAEQHAAQEDAEPVAVDAGIEEALRHDAEEAGAQQGAGHAAVAAGEQRAADDRGDDRLELLEQAARGVGRAEVEDLRGAEHGRAEGA